MENVVNLPRRRRERTLAGATRTFFVRVPPDSEVREMRTQKACQDSSHPFGVRISFLSQNRGLRSLRSLKPRLMSCHVSGVCKWSQLRVE
jgi:hypothetical protein